MTRDKVIEFQADRYKVLSDAVSNVICACLPDQKQFIIDEINRFVLEGERQLCFRYISDDILSMEGEDEEEPSFEDFIRFQQDKFIKEQEDIANIPKQERYASYGRLNRKLRGYRGGKHKSHRRRSR